MQNSNYFMDFTVIVNQENYVFVIFLQFVQYLIIIDNNK